MVRLRAVFVVALALGWSVATAAPAAAMTEKVTASLSSDECGFAVVTVKNSTDHKVDYQLGFKFQTLTEFSIEGDKEVEHRIAASNGDIVQFDGEEDVVGRDDTYAPENCDTALLEDEIDVSCTNALVTITNTGKAEAPDVRILANDQQVASGTIAAGRSLVGIAEPRPNETLRVVVQQRSLQPSDTFFEVFATGVELDQCEGRKVSVTDTCTGVRIEVDLTGATEPDRLIVERATVPTLTEEFEVTPPTDTVDIEVPTNTLLAIGFPFPPGLAAKSIGEDFRVVLFHEHIADCPPVPTPPAGGGGGLPVTGAPTATAAGVGAGLLLLGGAALLIMLRRRSTFTA